MSSPTVHSLSSILFLYGSQTGNAESIAKDLYSKIQTTLNEEHRLKINCMSMLDYITKYSNVSVGSISIIVAIYLHIYIVCVTHSFIHSFFYLFILLLYLLYCIELDYS